LRIRRATSRELEAFLHTKDLDELQWARQRLGKVRRRDSQAAQSVLEQWGDHQAVANVLFYPDLLPRPLQMRYLMKALEETDMPYFKLAAVLGLQRLTDELDGKLEKAYVDEYGASDEIELHWKGMGERLAQMRDRALGPPEREEWRAVRERLLSMIEDAGETMRARDSSATDVKTLDEAIADRATVLLPSLVDAADAPRLVGFLDHPSDGVRNNVLWTLLFLLGAEGVARLVAEATEASELSPAATEYVAENDEPMMLFAYIPNLAELIPGPDESLG
jgi:hypothetical protein